MAFSSLKDVLHVGFMNEQESARCPLSSGGLKLKQYNSSADFRSWALDKKEQSHFVADLVACRMYGGDDVPAGGDSRAVRGGQASAYQGLIPDYEKDSLLELAKVKLTNIDDLIAKNKVLQNQLEMSQENLDIVKDENIKIKGIVASGIDLQPMTPFQNKIKELKGSGKISDLDEKQLLELQKQFGKRDKAYEVLEAENASLRRLAEKLSRRANFDKLPPAAETSTDVKALQDKVNRLSKEVAVLRGIEEDFLRNKIKKGPDTKNNVETEKLNKLIQERNSLKEKFEKLSGLESRILALMKRADEAARLEKENAALKQQIAQKCGQAQQQGATIPHKDSNGGNYDALKAENARLKELVEKLRTSEGCLRDAIEKYKAQNLELQARIQDAELELKKLDTLHQELCLARSMIQRKESMLRQYECQLYQMKDIIEELSCGRQACEIKNLSDECTQTKDEHLGDLEWATRETLNQIKCEIEARGCLEKKLEELKVQNTEEINTLKDTNQNLKVNLDQTEAECCKKVAQLMSDLEAAKKKESDLLKQLSESENSNKTEKRKSLDLSNAKDGLQGDIGKLHDELGKLKGDLKAKENEINALNNKISDLEDQLRKCLADKGVKGDDGELDRLRQQLKDLQNKLDEEIKKSQACEEQSKKLKAQLEAAEKAKPEPESKKVEPLPPAPAAAQPPPATAPTSPPAQPPAPPAAPTSPPPTEEQAEEPVVEETVDESPPGDTKPKAAKPAGTAQKPAAAKPAPPAAAPKPADGSKPPATTTDATPTPAEPKTPGAKPASKATPRTSKKACKKPCKKPEKEEKKDDAEKYKCKLLDRNRSNYGYVCDQKMADSLLNISQQISDLCHSDNIERDVTKILNNIKDDLSTCQKYMKDFRTKLETICQKIIDKGIECLNIQDLIYLHREVYNAGMKLNPEAINSIMDEEVKCCKCKKFACCLPEYPKKNEKKLFMQITNLQTQIDSIGPDITKLAAQNKMKFLTNLSPHAAMSSSPPSSSRCGDTSRNSTTDNCSFNEFCNKKGFSVQSRIQG